ncbi:cysteine--tRNA ligase [Teredinibacter sp. KSP-S5-2]|uniref:cysteine--tRNA ligase n=1 Tax=Teredinibacter sp. KSP-S5-2 TaxID=3034506 RepID=UPI0029344D68|nr:cysteine--tRNA ligase [Teredinibacter sp. KSP-S5-2]WNO07663.1 cysteine--tRNA ligase [Teredinibacter sp. KSP-S5-2]
MSKSNAVDFSLYNTLSGKKEVFKPLVPGKINMYVCGITVYDYCHIGHARVLIAFDFITRYLRKQGWDVNYIRNVTDIDDKILKRANENGEEFSALAQRFTEAMVEDETRLGIIRPNSEPRATAHMDDILALIQALEDKGYAYQAKNGDVYYRVAKFEGYGKLTNKNSEELLAGARISVEDAKEDPRDFVLWKSAKEGEAYWESPWGKGRPGWHIECSAMSKACLGETLDIHGGGPDLPFPHHENEIAQSEAANGCQYANYWMHAGALRVDGEKMSKSLGNFFTIRDVLQNYHPEVVRFLLINSHYRSPINYSEENLIEAKNGLERFYNALRGYDSVHALDWAAASQTTEGKKYIEAMNDDFNTSIAIATMYELVREINSAKDSAEAEPKVALLKALAEPLGILQQAADDVLQAATGDEISAEDVEALIQARQQAKLDKDWGKADEIREQLTAANIILEDSKEGTTWRRA